MEINLKDKSILELKGIVYDLAQQVEGSQRAIRAINEELGLRARQMPIQDSSKNQSE